MLRILRDRFSDRRIVIRPVKVQGDGAAREIAEAIADFNRLGGVDVMIVGRGGGSLEDLWAFNEEIVARAICASNIPIVSAVGHEIDFTIADFVADCRAPTPTAAAEMIMPQKVDLLDQVSQLEIQLLRCMGAKLGLLKRTTTAWSSALPIQLESSEKTSSAWTNCRSICCGAFNKRSANARTAWRRLPAVSER